MGEAKMSRGAQVVPPVRARSGIGFAFDAVDFPVSATFAIFLDAVTEGGIYQDVERDWGDQITEKMAPALDRHMDDFRRQIKLAADTAFLKPLGRTLALRAYSFLASIMAGNPAFLSELHRHNRFIFVVSAPRHGGSYLTKELLHAMGKRYQDFPSYFMHDGFPDIRQAWLSNDGMELMPMTRRAMQQTAEWIVMADWYFRDDAAKSDSSEGSSPLRTIPKKATKAIYEARFFRDVFGHYAEYVVPVRHPAAACLSLVEKAGGMTENGLFPMQPRSAIEAWVLEAWAQDGVSNNDVAKMPYFKAYLHYWMRYYQIMATNGLFLNNKRLTILPYHKDSFEGYLQGQHNRFGSGRQVEPMYIQSKVFGLYPEWVRSSTATLDHIENLWSSFGVRFPRALVELAL